MLAGKAAAKRRELAWPIGLRQRAGLPRRIGPRVTAARAGLRSSATAAARLGGIRALAKVLAGQGTYPRIRTRTARWSRGTSSGELPVTTGGGR